VSTSSFSAICVIQCRRLIASVSGGPRHLHPGAHQDRGINDSLSHAARSLPGAIFGDLNRARQVCKDSPPERSGFELPVPLAKRVGLSGGTGGAAEAKRAVPRASFILGGPRVRILLPPPASLVRT